MEEPMDETIDVAPTIIGYRVNADDGTTTHLLALPENFDFVGFMRTSKDILSCIYTPAGPTGNRPVLQVKTRKGAESFAIDFAAYGPPGEPAAVPEPRRIDYAGITRAISMGSAS